MGWPSKTSQAYRCCNPFNKERHNPTSVRIPSETLLALFSNLSASDRLCSGCRNTLERDASKHRKIISDAESHSVTENNSPNDYENTNQFIEDFQDAGNQNIPVPPDVSHKAVNLFFHLKETYKSLNKLQKLQLLSALPSDWSVNFICENFEASRGMVEAGRNLCETKGMFSLPDPKKGKTMPDAIVKSVQEFYERDDISCPMPGGKDKKSVKQADGKRKILPKRFLLYNLSECHQLYITETKQKLSFTKFTLLRPKFIVSAGSSGTYIMCVCVRHQNPKLAFMGGSISSLTENTDCKLKSYRDCLKMIICSDPKEECYTGNCDKCPGIDNLKNYLNEIYNEAGTQEIRFKQWLGNPIALETLVKCPEDFVEYYSEKITELLLHDFIAEQQAKFYRDTKSNLKPGEFAVTVDFAENLACHVQNAAPGFHWNNNNQATLYNVVIYYKDEDGNLKNLSLVIVSDCLTHDAVAVYTFAKTIVEYLKSKFTEVNKIYYFSDGAPQQFKNFKHMFNLMEHEKEFSIKAEWHFFPTSHGKGPSDGLGATVKQSAIRYSIQAPVDKQITDCKLLYDWLSTTSRLPHIDFRFSSQKDYDANQRHLNARFKNNNRISHLKEQHCFIPMKNGVIRVKKFSYSSEFHDHKIC